MGWEQVVVAVLAALGAITLIAWLAHALVRQGSRLRPCISITMSVKNAAPEIEGVIRSLIIMGRAPHRWRIKRIAIVDHSSADETRCIVRRLAEKHPMVQCYDAPCTPQPLGETVEIIVDATRGWAPREASDALCSVLW